MKKILFTGGGSAGHVTPNVALIEKFQKENWQIEYIGSKEGIEKQIIQKLQIPYHEISTGKLRRYFSWQNFIDPFKVIFGVIQSFLLIKKIQPQIIFSKGGFVAVPVVFSAKLQKIPVICHESDFTPGLANKLCFPFVNHICVSFPETKQFIKNSKKIVVTGTPVREEFLSGNVEKGKKFLNFSDNKPILLITGGSVGAETINVVIRETLNDLLKQYNIAHICGAGKLNKEYENVLGYKQFEYLNEELFDVMAAADIVISRAGANSLNELIALKKLHLLIPIAKNASRGDQIVNAKYFANKGISKVLFQENLNKISLLKALEELEQSKAQIQHARDMYKFCNGTENIYNLLVSTARKKNL